MCLQMPSDLMSQLEVVATMTKPDEQERVDLPRVDFTSTSKRLTTRRQDEGVSMQ